MYAFTGFLAVAHFLRRRDLLAPLPAAPDAEGDEDLTPGRPLVASLFLIILRWRCLRCSWSISN